MTSSSIASLRIVEVEKNSLHLAIIQLTDAGLDGGAQVFTCTTTMPYWVLRIVASEVVEMLVKHRAPHEELPDSWLDISDNVPTLSSEQTEELESQCEQVAHTGGYVCLFLDQNVHSFAVSNLDPNDAFITCVEDILEANIEFR